MYSIWLLPSEKESKRFQKIIDILSELFKTPTFEPHITLYTHIPKLTDELFYNVSVLAALTNTFEVSIAEIQTSPKYYKSLFTNITFNHTLENLQQEVQNLFPGIDYDFLPHLSLLYGDIEEALKSEKIDAIREDLIQMFQVSRIAIVYTQGEVSDWKIIETFDFHLDENPHLEFIFDTVKNLKI